MATGTASSPRGEWVSGFDAFRRYDRSYNDGRVTRDECGNPLDPDAAWKERFQAEDA